MARPLLSLHRKNATIDEFKQFALVGFIETATRFSAIQMRLAGLLKHAKKDADANI
jgi:hypothetical protein